MTALLSLDDALAIMARVVRPITGHELRLLPDILHCVTAQEIIAPYGLPPFTNTGVDGYAFRHGGVDQRTYRLIGTSFAGQPFDGDVPEGGAVRIATGGVLPNGADTVVMQEQCVAEGEILTLTAVPAKGANIRRAGADIAVGAVALPAGRRLRPQDIALLGALGLTAVSVLRPLRVAIASTGQELVGAGVKLQPGQIVDTNSLMLRQLLAGSGVAVTMLDALPDDYEATRATLQSEADNHDLIITTGGVSVGARDYVRDVIHDVGRVHFWKLAIRPGKPALFGQIGGCLTMGLPGNPVSAFVTFFLLVRPLLVALGGGMPKLPPAYAVPLARELVKDVPLRSFPRVRLENGEAVPYHDQSSNLLTSLTDADGVLDLPAEKTMFAAGEAVMFRPFF